MRGSCSKRFDTMEYENSSIYGGDGDQIKWKEIGAKAAVTGVIAAAAGVLLLAPDQSGDVLGLTLPAYAALGVGCAAGSVAGDLAHNYVLPYIPQSEKYLKVESAAVSLGAAALGGYLALGAVGVSADPILPIGAAVGSYMAADYVYHKFIDTQSGGLLF